MHIWSVSPEECFKWDQKQLNILSISINLISITNLKPKAFLGQVFISFEKTFFNDDTAQVTFYSWWKVLAPKFEA